MKTLTSTKLFAVVFAMILLSAMSAFSMDAPKAPLKLSAEAISNNNGNVQNAALYWAADPEGTQPVLFVIYKADKITQDFSEFKRLDYVRAYNYFEYKHLLSLPAGSYTFYVTAAAIDGNTILESPPSMFAHVELKGPDNTPFIRIVSEPVTQAFMGQQYLYHLKVHSNINCPIDMFSFIGEVPQGMQIDQTGLITWMPTGEGSYEVAVQAGTSCKINVQPAVQRFVITVGNGNNEGYVRITSQFNPYGEVGKEYVYQVVTESNIRCPVLFELAIQPTEGVSFDKETGTLKILANSEMVYNGYIKAYLQCDEKIHTIQQFSIKFGQNPDHNPCATVFGSVNYDDNTPVPEAKIKFWFADQNSKQTAMFIAYVKDGKYSLKLPEGTYIADIDGPLVHEFWQDAETADKASRIQLVCDHHTQVDFNVAHVAQPKHFKVSGRVVRESDASPLITAVEFLPLEFINGRVDLNGNYYSQFIAKTDADGYYSIQLPNIYTYYAHALPPAGTDLLSQFYDGVDTYFEADILELTEDLPNINFALRSGQNHNNLFGGIVRDANGNPVMARVFAHLVRANDANVRNSFTQQVETDLQGHFTFKNLIPGEYVLLSIPFDKKYVPGYFKMGDFAVLKWKEASKVGIPNMLDVVFEIKHRERTGLKGVIRVDGTISDLSGRIGKSDVPLGSNALCGAFVYVLDENGDVSDYTFTDVNGYFEMIEVSTGANKLFVDKPGYTSYEQSLQNDYEKNIGSKFNLGLERETELIVFENTINSNGFTLFPMPASSMATLEFNGSEQSGTLSVFNMVGMRMQQINFDSREGLNQLKFDVSALPEGYYIVKIDLNGKTSVVPMNIAK